MTSVLLNFCIFVITVLYLFGSYTGLEYLSALSRWEKECKKEDETFHLRNKILMYIVTVIFSWLAVSALKGLYGENLQKNRSNK